MAKTKKVITEKVVSSNVLDFKSLENKMEAFFIKTLPPLPKNIVEILVKIAPWLAILGVIGGLQGLWAYYRLTRTPLFEMAMYQGWGYRLSPLIILGQLILTGLAIQGLFARKMSAWRLMYYSVWLSLLSSLLYGNLVSLVISGLISFYILFQVKGEYY